MGQKDTRSRRLWTSGLCALVLAGGMAGRAEGQTYVVDTGPGAAQGGLSLTRNQYLAGQFTLDLGHEINGLEGWMIYPTVIGELPVYVVLYGDDGGVPDLDNQLHSQLIQVPASGIPLRGQLARDHWPRDPGLRRHPLARRAHDLGEFE